MDLKGKKVLMVIAPHDFRDEEYFDTKEVLEKYGVTVTTVSTVGEAESKMGKMIKPDLMMGEVFGVNHDAIVFIGGAGAETYFSMRKAHQIVQQYIDEGKIAAAICIAPSTLANAGLLEGKTVTAFASEERNIKKQGGKYTGKPVERDGQIITANGPAASKDFAEEIAKALAE